MTRRDPSRRNSPVLLALACVAGALICSGLLANDYPSEEWSPYPSEAWSPYPSEAWSPYPSEAWSPRVAALFAPPANVPPELAGPEFPSLGPEGLSQNRRGLAHFAESAEQNVPVPLSADDLGIGPQFPDIETPRVALAPVFGAPPLESESWAERPVVGTTPSCPPCDHASSCNNWRPHSSFLPSLGRYGLVAPRTPGVESVHSAYVAASPCGPPSPHATLFAPPPCGEGEPYAPARCDLASGHRDQCSIAPAPPAGSAANTSSAPPDSALPGSVEHKPCIDPRAQLSPYTTDDFSPDPCYVNPYDPCAAQGVYGEKHLVPTQRPLVEWGFPLYDTGPVPPPALDFGPTNPSLPRFYLYGDYRAAAAYNVQNDVDKGVLAQRLNLEWDLWLTSTERFHMFTGPLQRGNNFQRLEFNNGDVEFFDEMDFFNADTDTAFFEGDLGYMLGGWTGKYAQFDLPITVGLIPLLFQNGVWMEDAIVGAAATIPARNSPFLDWSNYDITFFAGFDQVTTPAFDDNPAGPHVFGATTFIEAKGGYIELGYAYLDDTDHVGHSYHNVGLSYTRRYLNLLSNSLRVILNSGQNGPDDDRTANGVLLIAENSFLTPWPYNVIPYVNVWSGFDNPQSVARAGAAGGVLRNTGILFESDNLTGYPTLDATAANTYGAAVGIDLLSPEFTHQLILEAAVLQVFGDADVRNAAGDQFGIGARYQVPISHATLLRFDAMHGFFDDADDVSGVRAEFRWKF